MSKTNIFCILDEGSKTLCGRIRNTGEFCFPTERSAWEQTVNSRDSEVCKDCANLAITALRKAARLKHEPPTNSIERTLISLIARAYAEHHQWDLSDCAVRVRYLDDEACETWVSSVDMSEGVFPPDTKEDPHPTQAPSLLASLIRLARALIEETQEQYDTLNKLRTTLTEVRQ